MIEVPLTKGLAAVVDDVDAWAKITLDAKKHKHVQRRFISFDDAVACRKEMEMMYFKEFARQ